ncbi:MAG: DUF748 domain-containing protein [Cellulophaga sp.]|uniref:DUF748 domain-containing protein n=1 Tax=Cellulophaga sp. TaxID=1972202 RepID=UPI003264C5F1
MINKKKNIIKITTAVIALFLVFLLCAHWFVKHKINQQLQYNLPQHITINYNSISLNLLLGNVGLDKISFKEESKGNNKTKIVLKAAKIAIKDLSYIDLLFYKKLSLNKLKITSPELTKYTVLDTITSYKEEKKEGIFTNPISISEFKITNGNITFLNAQKTTAAKAEHIFINLKDVVFKADKEKNTNPLEYKYSNISAHKLYANLGKFEEINAEKLKAQNESILFKNLQLKTKYTKEELSKKITIERDFINLKIKELALENTSFSYSKLTSLLNISKVYIAKPNLEVYRDKLIADDFSYKPMYSKMLRDLSLKIGIDSILIQQGNIAYQEKLTQHIKPQKLSFNNINATISNLNNYNNKTTTVHTNSLLMNKTPLELNWSFNIHNTTDFFKAWGSFTNLDIASINPFLNTNLRATAEGDMQQMYFTVSGNKQKSAGDLKIKYNNFKFKVLKKDRLGVNKLLTKIGNLLIKEGSKANPEDYRYGEIEVERDTTKSFFNYLWINVKAGLLDALTGKGTKKH